LGENGSKCNVLGKDPAMAENVENLILEHLRAIRSDVTAVCEDMRELKTRLSISEQQYASISSRIDRIEARLERIEGWLELVDSEK
jgi:predicted  nucleic acid-binding Zn-ribbon protein